jgi:hypothetical protein
MWTLKEQAMHRFLYLLAIIILMASPFKATAQQNGAAPAEVLTWTRPSLLPCVTNRDVTNARLSVGKSEDQVAAARTYRLPKFEFNALAGNNS